jgi:hypothetical protein
MALVGIPDLPDTAFQHDGNRKIKPQGGGGPSQTTSYQTNIPAYLRPYVETMMGATEKQIYTTDASGKPTGFKPFQSYSEYDKKRGGTGESVAGFTPMQTEAMKGIQNYRLPGQTGQASEMAGYAGLNSMMAGQNYQNMATNPMATQAYMSPYIQGALNPQMEEARRQSGITGLQNQAAAIKAGAFGGSGRFALEGTRQRELGRLQDQIYGTGMQNAFQAAQQAQQFGANLDLQGQGQALQGARTLGEMGQQQYGQEMGLLGQQAAMGKQQQEYEQSRLNQIIQDYATTQQYPFMQLGILNAMTRGLPMQSVNTSMYQAQPSNVQQLMGTAGMLLDRGKTAKEGGAIKEMASGGITNPYKLAGMAKKLSDPQLDGQEDDPMGVMEAEKLRRKEVRGMASGGIIAFKEGKEVDDKNPFKDEKPKGMFPIGEDLAEGKSTDTTSKVSKKAPRSEGIATKAAAPQEDGFFERYQKRISSALEDSRKPDPYQDDLLAARQEALKGVRKTDAQLIQEEKDKERAAGVKTDFITNLRKTYTKQLDAMADEAEDQKYLRRAQAWAVFGSTPGPLLKVGLQAMAGYINDTMEDTKARKKAMNELNKAIYEVDHAEYLISVGRMDKANTTKLNAFKTLNELNGDLSKIRQRQREAELGATTEGAKSAMQAEARIAEQKIQSGATIAAARERTAGANKEEALALKETTAAYNMYKDWKKGEDGKKLSGYETARNINPEKFDKGPLKLDYDRLKREEQGVKEAAKEAFRRSNMPVPADVEGSAAASAASIAPGQVVDGYKFKGGNPNDKSNWEKAK